MSSELIRRLSRLHAAVGMLTAYLFTSVLSKQLFPLTRNKPFQPPSNVMVAMLTSSTVLLLPWALLH